MTNGILNISQWNHRDIVGMQCDMLDLTPRTQDGRPSGVSTLVNDTEGRGSGKC